MFADKGKSIPVNITVTEPTKTDLGDEVEEGKTVVNLPFIPVHEHDGIFKGTCLLPPVPVMRKTGSQVLCGDEEREDAPRHNSYVYWEELEKARQKREMEARADVSPGRHKWKTLSAVIKACSHFQCPEVRKIENPDDLIKEVGTEEQLAKKRSHEDKHLQFRMYRERAYLRQLIELGKPEDLQTIQRLVDGDPNRFRKTLDDPEAYANHPDANGKRPLHVACQHGHLEVIKLLMSRGADPLLLSQEENCLEVAARWGYSSVVSHLLHHVKWPKSYLEKALESAANREIGNLIDAKLNGKAKSSFFACSSK